MNQSTCQFMAQVIPVLALVLLFDARDSLPLSKTGRRLGMAVAWGFFLGEFLALWGGVFKSGVPLWQGWVIFGAALWLLCCVVGLTWTRLGRAG